MMAVMSGPPENAFLRGGHGHPGNDELEPAAGLEGAVREIAVVAGGDEEHADFVGEETRERVIPLEGEEEDAENGQVNKGKRNRGDERQTRPVWQRDRQGPSNRSHAGKLLRERSGGWGARVVLSATDHIK